MISLEATFSKAITPAAVTDSMLMPPPPPPPPAPEEAPETAAEAEELSVGMEEDEN